MADKDVNIHVNIEDADAAKRQIDDVNESLEGMGDTSERSGEKGSRSADMQGSSMADLSEKVLQAIGIYKSFEMAINLVTQALKTNVEAMNESADAANRQQNSMTRLLFMGDYYQENPQARAEARAEAEFAARDVEEVAGAKYNLYSKTSQMDPALRNQIFRESLEFARTDPSAPLDTIVDMFTLYQKETGADPAAIQNVMAQTITEAGGGLGDMASYMPRFLPIGMAGDLTGAESAGLWAWATTRESEASVATTGLRAIMMSLQGKGTPESAKLLSSYGISPDMPFADKLSMLHEAQASGALDLSAAETIAQREGASMFLKLAADPEAAIAAMSSVTAAYENPADLTAQKIDTIFGGDRVAYMEEQTRRTDIAIENLKADQPINQARKLMIKEIEQAWREEGVSDWRQNLLKGPLELLMGTGMFDYRLENIYGLNQEPTGTGQTIINNNNVVYVDPESPVTERYPQ